MCDFCLNNNACHRFVYDSCVGKDNGRRRRRQRHARTTKTSITLKRVDHTYSSCDDKALTHTPTPTHAQSHTPTDPHHERTNECKSQLASRSRTFTLNTCASYAFTLRMARSCTHSLYMKKHARVVALSHSFQLTQIQIGCLQCADCICRFKRYQSVVSLAHTLRR